MTTNKTCAKCKQAKPAPDFVKNVRNKDGLHSYCKECNNLISRERRDNPRMTKPQRTPASEVTVIPPLRPHDSHVKATQAYRRELNERMWQERRKILGIRYV